MLSVPLCRLKIMTGPGLCCAVTHTMTSPCQTLPEISMLFLAGVLQVQQVHTAAGSQVFVESQ